jgi:uncharacterized membrane protein (DUF441 family)
MKAPLFLLKLSAWFNGRRDGKDGVPHKETKSPPQWEVELKNRYENTVRRIIEGFVSKESIWSHKYKNCIEEIGTNQLKCKDIEDSLLKREGRLHLNTKIGKTAYIIILLILALTEVPINSIVFDILQEAKIFSYILAFGLAFVLMLMAHIVGSMIRHREHKSIQIGLIIVTVAVLAGISYLRSNYFAAENLSEGFLKSLDLKAVLALFWGINIMIFFIAIVLSYYAHDSNHDFEKEYKALLRLLRRLTCLKEREEQIGGKRIQNYEVTMKILQSYEDTFQSLIARYRRTNLRYRPDKDIEIFNTEPTLEYSIELKEPKPDEASKQKQIREEKI